MNFDPIAPYYDRLAHLVFGRTLDRAQMALLNRLPTGGRWLILGGGTGWLLEQVLHRCQPDSVLYLEASARMLTLARRRLANHPNRHRVVFRHGTEAALLPNETFDVILTPFVLDLFREEWLANVLLPRLRSVLQPGGYWLVSDFVPPRNAYQRLLVKTMLLFFRATAGLTTTGVPNWRQLLQSELRSVAGESTLRGLVCSVLFKASP